MLGVVLIFIAGVVWWGLAASNKPQLQGQISMPDMAGTGQFLVNVWLDPHPATTGTNILTAQVTSTIGTATPLDSIVLHLTSPNGAPPQMLTLTKSAGSDPADSFTGQVDFDAAGQWQVAVEVHNGDVVRTATFFVNVKQS